MLVSRPHGTVVQTPARMGGEHVLGRVGDISWQFCKTGGVGGPGAAVGT